MMRSFALIEDNARNDPVFRAVKSPVFLGVSRILGARI